MALCDNRGTVMSTKPKKTARGKRYTDSQKAEIVGFVNKYNADNGRGGQSVGSKKFKISPLTISSWLKKSGAPKTVAAKTVTAKAAAPKATAAKPTGKRRGRPPGPAKAKAQVVTSGPIGKKLAKLQSLHNQIERTEADLATLQVQFKALKASL